MNFLLYYTLVIITTVSLIPAFTLSGPADDAILSNAVRTSESNVNSVEKATEALEKGADINKSIYNTSIGLVPLLLDVLFKKSDRSRKIAYLLLDKGVNTQVKDREGRTTLHYASLNGNTQLMQRLLNSNTLNQVNAQDKEGYTPLMVAVINGYPEIVQLLLSKGATINLKTAAGTDVFDLFREVQPQSKANQIKKVLLENQGTYLGLSALSGYSASDIPALPKDIVTLIGGYVGFKPR
ncbi:ankyrin repeat domain-containing protein [Candidatus Dependentiae bacterium]|nr:ankyrin repeat domain-containing protein [Candidatus Dependentiae bacterium]